MFLTRQRMQLAFIAKAKRRVTRTKLERWLFLAATEYGASRIAPFYDFLAAPFGPLSFTALYELALLKGAGLVTEIGKRVERRPGRAVDFALEPLPEAARLIVDAVLEAHGTKSETALLHEIDRRHPRFAAGSPSLGSDEPFLNAVYTCGYQGVSVERFLDALQSQGFERLIDVRHHAYSRKYGFTGGLLKSICSLVKLAYVHVPELGLPGPLRRELNKGDFAPAILEHYRAQILPSQGAAQQRVAAWVEERPSVLMCFEAHAEDCHRGSLASRIAERTRLPVFHLKLARTEVVPQVQQHALPQ